MKILFERIIAWIVKHPTLAGCIAFALILLGMGKYAAKMKRERDVAKFDAADAKHETGIAVAHERGDAAIREADAIANARDEKSKEFKAAREDENKRHAEASKEIKNRPDADKGKSNAERVNSRLNRRTPK